LNSEAVSGGAVISQIEGARRRVVSKRAKIDETLKQWCYLACRLIENGIDAVVTSIMVAIAESRPSADIGRALIESVHGLEGCAPPLGEPSAGTCAICSSSGTRSRVEAAP
jgi:hypothetical protein